MIVGKGIKTANINGEKWSISWIGSHGDRRRRILGVDLQTFCSHHPASNVSPTVSQTGRATLGVRLIKMEAETKVGVTKRRGVEQEPAEETVVKLETKMWETDHTEEMVTGRKTKVNGS